MRCRLVPPMLGVLLSACGAGSASLSATSRPTPLPSATATDAESGDPPEVAYVDWESAAFTVIDSAAADELFGATATCTNDTWGYTVSYPATWHTNEGGQAPSCSWFGPAPFASDPLTLAVLSRPEHVPIGLLVFRGGIGHIPEWPMLLSEEVVIGGIEGGRTEVLIPGQPPEFTYGYSAWLEPNFDGLKLTGGTSSTARGDYVLNKAVLDRIMALIEFDE